MGADRYRNPEDDVPPDFVRQRQTYYTALQLPTEAEVFVRQLQQEMREELAALDRTVPTNPDVSILEKAGGWIKLSPLTPQPEPANLVALKEEIARRWPMTSLLDILKETDLRVGFTHLFRSPTAWENLDRDTLQYRLLLTLYGLGTGAGLKWVGMGHNSVSYRDLLYIRRRFITKDHLRQAIAQVVNGIFAARLPEIWGEGTKHGQDLPYTGGELSGLASRDLNRRQKPSIQASPAEGFMCSNPRGSWHSMSWQIIRESA